MDEPEKIRLEHRQSAENSLVISNMSPNMLNSDIDRYVSTPNFPNKAGLSSSDKSASK